MSKNKEIHFADAGQVVKRTFSPKHDATRVINVGETEVEFSLSHNDGDSIITKGHSLLLEANLPHDCSHISRIMAYEDSSVQLFATEELTYTLSLKAGEIKEICAITLISSAPIVGQ